MNTYLFMLRRLYGLSVIAMATIASPVFADDGITDTKILLGQSAAFSGPAAQLGVQMNTGAKAYFDQVNKAGGVFGRKIELRTLDDQYEADKAAANTRRLIEQEKVFALFGYVGTPTSNASLPIFTAAKVPFFAPFTGAMSLREPMNRYVFNIRASYFDETAKIVEQLITVGMKRIAVFYQNDAYGKTGLEGVVRAMTERQLKIVGSSTVERNSVDVQKAVSELGPLQADAVIMISAYSSCAAFVKTMKKAGFNGQFHNVSFVGAKALADALGPDAPGVVVSQVVPFPWAAAVPVVREYQKAMREAGVTEWNFSSMEGFIAAKVFTEGLRRAGRDLSREKLIASLETLNRFDIGGIEINFTPTSHSGSKFVEMTIIGSSGRFLK